MRTSEPAVETLLLGRARELAAITAVLHAGAQGGGRLLIIEGEAGAGKTTLLGRARHEADRQGFRVLHGRGGLLERERGFGAVRQLFEAAIVNADVDTRSELLRDPAALAAPLLGVAAPAHAQLPDAIDPLQARHGLYWLTAYLAEQAPLAIVVDDAQWCDDATLDWVLYLLRRIEQLPITVLLGVRTGETDTPAHLLQAIAAERATEVLSLARLEQADTTALLQARFGDSVDPAFAAACQAWTAGNPHYLCELALELAAAGVQPTAAAIEQMQRLSSAQISAVTLARVTRLAPTAIALAQALAILGSWGELSHAAILADLTQEDAVEAADALVAAQIIDVDGVLSFVHPLVASVVYESLAPTRRAADHKRAAVILGEGGVDIERVAAHLTRTMTAGDPWVVETLRDAAGRELERGSAAAAVTLLRRARNEPARAEELAALLLTLGLAESLAGDPAGLSSLREALAVSTKPIEAARIALALGRFLMIAGQPESAVATLEPVIEVLDERDHDLHLRLQAAVISAAHASGNLRVTAKAHLNAVADFASEDSPAGRLVAAQAAYAAVAAGDSVEQAVGLARTALREDLLLRETSMSPDLHLVPMSMLALCDELIEADSRYGEALTRARNTGSELAYAATATLAGWNSFLLGRLDEAELLARDALRITGDSPAFTALAGFARAHLVCVLVERGANTEALALLDSDMSVFTASTATWATDLMYAAGCVLLAANRPADALAVLIACGERSAALGIENPAFLPWRSRAALAARVLGDERHASELCDEELLRARRFGARRPLGIALRTAGLLRAGKPGLALLDESVRVLEGSAATLERAHSLVALGAAMRRAGDRRESRDSLAQGLALAQRCGANALVARAETELSASGARPRAHGRWGLAALTPSELRVCEMAARGLTNPQIAQALFVTRGTVESHFHAAYRKLGIGARTELGQALSAHRRSG